MPDDVQQFILGRAIGGAACIALMALALLVRLITG